MWIWDVLPWVRQIDARLARIETSIVQQGRATRREIDMATGETQEAIDALKAEATRQTDAVVAMNGAVDAMLARLQEVQDDPTELRDALAAFRANTQGIIAAAAKGTVLDRTNPPAGTPAPAPQGGQG